MYINKKILSCLLSLASILKITCWNTSVSSKGAKILAAKNARHIWCIVSNLKSGPPVFSRWIPTKLNRMELINNKRIPLAMNFVFEMRVSLLSIVSKVMFVVVVVVCVVL